MRNVCELFIDNFLFISNLPIDLFLRLLTALSFPIFLSTYPSAANGRLVEQAEILVTVALAKEWYKVAVSVARPTQYVDSVAEVTGFLFEQANTLRLARAQVVHLLS